MRTRSRRPVASPRPAVLLLAILQAVVWLAPRPAAAASLTWTGAVSDRTEVAGNWSPAQLPAANDDLTWNAPGGIFVHFGLPAVQSSRSWTITDSKQIHTSKAHTVTQNIRLTGSGALTVSSLDSIVVNGDIENDTFGTLTIQAGCPVVGVDSVRFGMGNLMISGLNSRLLARHVHMGGGILSTGLGARLVASHSLGMLPGAQVLVSGTNSSITAPSLYVPSGSGASVYEGRLRLTGGFDVEGTLSLGSGARVEASAVRVLPGGGASGNGTIAAPFELDQAVLVANLGKLTVGDAANPAGVTLAGTIDVQGQSELECLSASPVTLPASVFVNAGTLRSATGFVHEDGSLLARGVIAGDLAVVGGEFSGLSGVFGVPGRATVQGDWSQGAAAYRSLLLSNAGAGWETDSLVVTGQAEPGGMLDIYYDEFSGTPSNPIPFLFYASRPPARVFDSLFLNGVPVTTELQVQYLSDRAVIVFDGSVSVGEGGRPGRLALAGRSGPSAALDLSLPSASDVTLDLHDVAGRSVARVHDGPLPAGAHRFELSRHARFDGLSSGVYFARADVRDGAGGRAVRTAKVVLRR